MICRDTFECSIFKSLYEGYNTYILIYNNQHANKLINKILHYHVSITWLERYNFSFNHFDLFRITVNLSDDDKYIVFHQAQTSKSNDHIILHVLQKSWFKSENANI